MKWPAPILFLICIFIARLTHADTVIYKWIDKNGVVSFSQNEPSPQQAKDVTSVSITIQTMPESERRAAQRMLSNLEKTEENSFARQKERLQQADQRVDTALKNLTKAERNLANGSIPTGDDRVGNVNHRARLRESYFIRVSDLQYEVDKARRELNAAYEARDQIGPGSP